MKNEKKCGRDYIHFSHRNRTVNTLCREHVKLIVQYLGYVLDALAVVKERVVRVLVVM